MGTDFFIKGATSSSQPIRSSSQLWMLLARLILALPVTPHEDLVAANLHFKTFQRARRRPRDVTAAQVVHAVMAGAPNLMQIGAVLHGAGQVRTRSRHRTILSAGGADQKPGAAAEAKDLSTIERQLSNPASHNRIASQVGCLGWDQEAQDGIHKGNRGGDQSAVAFVYPV